MSDATEHQAEQPAQPAELEQRAGRERKIVQRLEVEAIKTTEDVEVFEGAGNPLQHLKGVDEKLRKLDRKSDEAKLLHRIIYGRPGQAAKIKKNLLTFSGIDPSTEEKVRQRLCNASMREIKTVCSILKQSAPPSASEKDAVIDGALMPFLKKPSGKASTPAKAAPKKRKASIAEEKKEKKAKKPKAESKQAPKKTTAKKSKKVESEDDDVSEDDDEPLVKSQDAVSDDQIKDKVKEICATSSMEDLTMREVKKKLSDAFGDALDLQAKKAWIKGCVNECVDEIAKTQP